MADNSVVSARPTSASEAFLRSSARKRLIILGLALFTLLLAVFAIHAGAAQTTPLQVLRALLHLDTGISNVVIWNIRLPRILAAIAAGAGLAVAGCVMQTCLRNPLASPSTLGISNAAAFGANLAIVFFGAGTIHSTTQDAVSIGNPYLVTVTAFLFSMIAMTLILLLARLRGFSPESVVLAGVAFGSLFTAGSTLVQYFAQDVQVAAMVFWTFGDLGRMAWREIAILAILTGVSSVYFLLRRWDYNALDSGDDTAAGLGVRVDRIRFLSMLAASLVTAVAVSFMGIIGFIGLIAPHMMRRVVGVDHRFLIPASAVAGAALLLLSDTLARTVVSPVVLPVGVLTSFFGAPLFLFLLAKGYAKQ
ncbi:MAG: iron ABC transporter permease [Anaerolineales bacterium]|nr:iron ABC transporter permease [Anaerolineales bacterium]